MRGHRWAAFARWLATFALLGILGLWPWSLWHGVQYDGDRWMLNLGEGRILIRFSSQPRPHNEPVERWSYYRIVNGLSQAFAHPYWGTDWAGTGPNVPFWLLALLVGAPTVVTWYRRPRRRVGGCCDNCGYDLTGNFSGRCPECGTPTARQLKVDH